MAADSHHCCCAGSDGQDCFLLDALGSNDCSLAVPPVAKADRRLDHQWRTFPERNRATSNRPIGVGDPKPLRMPPCDGPATPRRNRVPLGLRWSRGPLERRIARGLPSGSPCRASPSGPQVPLSASGAFSLLIGRGSERGRLSLFCASGNSGPIKSRQGYLPASGN